MVEAKRSNEIVTLAESTLIRFIDNINGVDTDGIYERLIEIKNEIRWLKSGYDDVKSKVRLRELYTEANNLLFIPEYLLLVIDKTKDYNRAVEGFAVNGIAYKRLIATAAGVKTRTIIFVAAHMRDDLLDRLNNGRDMSMPSVPSKLESYMGLTASASKPVSAPHGVIVIKDCVNHFLDDYLLLQDTDDSDEPIITEVHQGEVEVNNSDGYGIAMPSLLERWSKDLGEDEIVSGVCIRNAFCKGMVFPFDFYDFALMVANNDTVTDIWGKERNIYEAELILTESMLKLWDSYNSYEDYAENCDKNGYTFSVAKTVEQRQQDSRELNYQFIQPFELSDADIMELISPTICDINGVLGGDPAKALIYLRGLDQNDHNTEKLPDDYIKAMSINSDVLNDNYVRSQISKSITKRIDKAKLGRIRVRGDFNVVSGDPYALCQSMFGLDVTGLLPKGAAFSWYWTERNVNEVLAFRAPMTNGHSIRKLNLDCSGECCKWYRYMKNIVILNGWDLTAAAENGCDYDGDSFLTTDNPVLMRCFRETLPIQCVQKKAKKIVPTELDFVAANCASFGDDIGAVTNRITAMFDVASTFSEDSDMYKTLQYRIMCGQQFQQNSIDKAKGVICKDMPSRWYSRHAANKSSQIDVDIVADRKPYFMIYRYPNKRKQYNAFIKKCKFDCMWKFGVKLNELLTKPNKTDEEAKYAYWFQCNCPVSLGKCTMNRMCRIVEDKLACAKNAWKIKSESFSYAIYRSNNTSYSAQQFTEVYKIIKDYESELNSVPSYAEAFHLSDAEATEYRATLTQLVKEELYCNCPNTDVLCNIVLDSTCSTKGTSALAWSLCGDVMIRNLLKRNGGEITYYTQDVNGNIEYKGVRFTDKIYTIEGDVIVSYNE